MNERLNRLIGAVAKRSVPELTRLACVLALIGLVVMVYPLLFPGALAIVLSMGVGHTIGMAAVALYLLAVILDLAQRRGE
ncbi:MAG TPA: hypothetical protein VJN18_12270 [Polyangiaceae bacterium]|nr:hypothetical protein [Polyangiaceae bacterium]